MAQTIRQSSFAALLLAALWLVLGSATAHAQEPRGELVSVSREVFQFDVPTALVVTVRNTGPTTFFRLTALEQPAGWSVAQDGSRKLIENGDEDTFTLTITASSTAQGSIKFRFFGDRNQSEFFPVLIDEEVVQVTAKNFPGPFSLTAPAANASGIPFQTEFEWQASSEASTYTLRIHANVNGQPSANPITQIDGITTRFYEFDGTGLFVDGTIYWWRVGAVNEIGVRENTGSFRRFAVAESPEPGSFSITTPVPGGEASREGPFDWTDSTNATSYNIEFYEDFGGLPGETPVRVYSTTSSLLELPGDPLPAAFLHIRVLAKSGSRERENAGGKTRFRASSLKPFSLIGPLGESLVGRTPDFAWQSVQPAFEFQEHVLRIYRTGEAAPDRTYSTALGVFTVPGNEPLNTGTRYEWDVEAVGQTERRFNEGGRGAFITSFVDAFELISPEPDAVGVAETPSFSWQPSPGASGYNLWLFGNLNGQPDFNNAFVSPVLTETNWTSTLGPLGVGQTYFWRVVATDGTAFRENNGGIRKFTTLNIPPFSLQSPANSVAGVATEPTLFWSAAQNATRYRVDIEFLDGADLPRFEVSAPATSANLATFGVQLNGETGYRWSVTAIGAGGSRRSTQEWTFTTAVRATATREDAGEMVVGRQRLSAQERNALGVFSGQGQNVVDAAALVRLAP
ncbi:MAG: hypothetical protein SF028_04065 [Candidatus Sumerlaeia bacterium]|nr:hypothetical protein [Candidatus Sumerlaeia bacterium]